DEEQKPAAPERKVTIWQVAKDEAKRPLVDVERLNRAADGSTVVPMEQAAISFAISFVNPLQIVENWFDPDIPAEQKILETSLAAATLGLGKAPARPRAYSVAFETAIPRTGVGTRPAHFKAANDALRAEMKAHPDFAKMIDELGIDVPTVGKSP